MSLLIMMGTRSDNVFAKGGDVSAEGGGLAKAIKKLSKKN